MTSCQRKALLGLTLPPYQWASQSQANVWKRKGSTLFAHQKGLREVVIPPYPEHKSGRGIVIAGGGNYLVSTLVTVLMIRRVNASVPIELWSLGRLNECPAMWEKLFNDQGVNCVNADMVDAAQPVQTRILNGYELKDFAVYHSSFKEVLFLDADSYPVIDPMTVFDGGEFTETRAVFFPDNPSTNEWTDWKFFNVEPHPPACGWETGQYFIDTEHHWPVMQTVRWLNDHSDWCYGVKVAGDLGDKGPWRVGFALHKRTPTFFNLIPTWHAVAFTHNGSDGNPLFVHRIRDKFRLPGTEFTTTKQNTKINQPFAGLPGEHDAFDAYRKVCSLLTMI